MSIEALRAALSELRYEVRFHQHEWCDCLLLGNGETWRGSGANEAAALEDAVKIAFPSHGARELLRRAANNDSPPAPSQEPRPELVSDTPRLVARAEPENLSHDQAVMMLGVLSKRIDDSSEELGLCSPERQRLAILAWICEARAHTDTFPDSQRIRDEVASISRRLTELGKSLWPGSVTALQLQMQPRDLPRHLLGGAARSWVRAAELAERALKGLEYLDERRGHDAYGWADPPSARPLPGNPEDVFAALVREIEAFSGPVGRLAEPRQTGARPTPEQFLSWVRTLRWMRNAPVDLAVWARVAGRLRWWATRRDAPLSGPARELEPSFRPPKSWPELLLREDGGAPATAELPADVVTRVQSAFSGMKMVFVSHRRDPDLQEMLGSALAGVSFDWRIVEPRRLRDLGEQIEDGAYDMVLGAVGFQSQGVDHLLAAACRNAGVEYVRIARERPIVCLRALARQLDAREMR